MLFFKVVVSPFSGRCGVTCITSGNGFSLLLVLPVWQRLRTPQATEVWHVWQHGETHSIPPAMLEAHSAGVLDCTSYGITAAF